MPTISLGRALADPNLFARHFRNKSWAGWKTFLAALFAEAPGPGGLEVYRAQDRADGVAYRAVHRGCGDCRPAGRQEPDPGVDRRLFGRLSRLHALSGPWRGGDVGVLAVDKGQARAIFRFVIGLLRAVPMLEPLIVQAGHRDDRVEQSGHDRDRHGAFRITRGYSYAAVLCDEVAFWRSDETSLNPDVEIMRALRPGLASIPGSHVADRFEPYASAASFTTPFAGITVKRRCARLGLESLDRGDESEH